MSTHDAHDVDMMLWYLTDHQRRQLRKLRSPPKINVCVPGRQWLPVATSGFCGSCEYQNFQRPRKHQRGTGETADLSLRKPKRDQVEVGRAESVDGKGKGGHRRLRLNMG
ncbi:hypothetical protein RvY_03072-1 [Ramazzottius varieornatus]|uniref:Uncharacterized protein n=1 Tax=Ramazzottius varieornatus TaxID=947166 RepID=A0A1D1UMN2_RAMVA|nr:hypothetical protein RvY_03072-1 [Ramazzottius varieornatus]